MGTTLTETDRKHIFKERPLLKYLLDTYKTNTVLEYFSKILSSLQAGPSARKSELVAVCEDMVTERLGKPAGQGVAQQLEKFFFASTAEHHAFLNSDLALSSHILLNESLKSFGDQTILKYILIFSCANITLNNEDYPRGFRFHTLKDEEFLPINFSALPSNAHNSTTYSFRAYSAEEIDKMMSALRQKISQKEITMSEGEIVKNAIATMFNRPDILDSRTVCEQITKLNYFFWPRLTSPKESASQNNKGLVYIEQEEIVNRLLLNYHLFEKSPLNQILFNPEYYDTLIIPLAETVAPLLRQGNVPTYLFWYIAPAKKNRKKLIRNGNFLVTEDGEIKIELTPDSIAAEIRNKNIMPNILLTYLVLHCYYGLNCLGGFNQIHYLPEMRRVYAESKIDPEAPNAESLLYTYGFDFANLEKNGIKIPMTGLDFEIHSENNSYEKIVSSIKKTNYETAFAENMFVINEIIKEV